MENRWFEKRMEILPEEGMETSAKSFELEYYILESDMEQMDEPSKVTGYGVEIVKKMEGSILEIKAVKNIFCCRQEADRLVELLASHTVTPVTLPYILDDMIGV